MVSKEIVCSQCHYTKTEFLINKYRCKWCEGTNISKLDFENKIAHCNDCDSGVGIELNGVKLS
jgi:hypothetical protein